MEFVCGEHRARLSMKYCGHTIFARRWAVRIAGEQDCEKAWPDPNFLGLRLPSFDRGAFTYSRAFLEWEGAITIGNVISGNDLDSTMRKSTSTVREHEYAHIPQSSVLGSLYLPTHALTLGITNFLPGGHHGSYNFLECSSLWASVPHGGTCR